MWSITSLARPGAWLCLLGSLLALVAFFLPCVTYAPGNLENCLTSCALDLIFPSYSTPFQPVPWAVGALLLLLSISVLGLLMLFLRSPRSKSRTIYLRLTTWTLTYYLSVALFTLCSAWIGEAIAAPVTFTDVLSWIGIGAWLIPVGLLLALIGGILLKQQDSRTAG